MISISKKYQSDKPDPSRLIWPAEEQRERERETD